MKTKLIAASLFTLTAGVVLAYPVIEGKLMQTVQIEPSVIQQPLIEPIRVPIIDPLIGQAPKIEVVFVLDTTGSMGGMIGAAKEKIWSIATTMASAQSSPEIKMGLVAYRDRGDAYVTRTIDLSSDLDSMYASLMDFSAGGGGDGPESVNQALYDAIHNMTWSQDASTYRVIFLIGDAPAHMDYQDDVKYPVSLAAARQKGIIVNTIQCGEDIGARHNWLQVASLGNGDYFQVEQAGSAIAIATPFDKTLAELSVALNDTRMVFGNAEEQQAMVLKGHAIDKLYREASVSALARRASFNATSSGEKNFLGDNELVHAVTAGKVDLEAMDEADLPASLQAMDLDERKKTVALAARERREIQDQIAVLSRDRSDFLKQKVAEAGGGKDSLDEKIYQAVKAQAAAVGLNYEAESAEY